MYRHDLNFVQPGGGGSVFFSIITEDSFSYNIGTVAEGVDKFLIGKPSSYMVVATGYSCPLGGYSTPVFSVSFRPGTSSFVAYRVTYDGTEISSGASTYYYSTLLKDTVTDL